MSIENLVQFCDNAQHVILVTHLAWSHTLSLLMLGLNLLKVDREAYITVFTHSALLPRINEQIKNVDENIKHRLNIVGAGLHTRNSSWGMHDLHQLHQSLVKDWMSFLRALASTFATDLTMAPTKFIASFFNQIFSIFRSNNLKPNSLTFMEPSRISCRR